MSGVTNEPLWTQGTVVAERFRLLSHVDDAPIGERWRADDGGTAVHVTALTPRADLSAEARDELRVALSEFGHPHAVTVLATGVHDGRVWVATQITAGTPLRAWIADHRARDASVSIRDARSVFDQVTQCLAASHRADVALVHGFSLAGSVRVERRGEVQLVASLGDLGLLSLSNPEGVATPSASASGPTVADDIHGVGALLAEVLTDIKVAGRPDLDTLVTNLSAARPDVDASLWKIVRACLSADATQRPANVGRVREMIRGANWTPCEIREVAPATAPPPAPSPSPATKPAAPERARIVSVSSTVDRTSAPLAVPRVAAAPPPAPAVAQVAVPAPPVTPTAPPVAPPPPAPRVAAAAPPPPTPPAPSRVAIAAPPAPAPVALPVPAPTIAPASPRSFASPQSEATVLTALPSTSTTHDETVEHAGVIASSPITHHAHDVTRRGPNPIADRVSALPKGARALFDEESTTLHLPSSTPSGEHDDTSPGLDEVPFAALMKSATTSSTVIVNTAPAAASLSASPLGAAPLSASPLGAKPLNAAPLNTAPLGTAPLNTAPLSAAPSGVAQVAASAPPIPPPAPSASVKASPLAERPDLEELIRREETAPESLGFAPSALLAPESTLVPDSPTLSPLSRAVRPATMAPPTPLRPAPVGERSVVVAPVVFNDAFAITEEPTATATPRVATMPPPTARFADPMPPLLPPAHEDPASHTLPVPVRAMPFVMSPPPPAPRQTPPPSVPDAHDEHEPARSLFEPPLVWWFVAALAGVVTLLIAVAATSH